MKKGKNENPIRKILHTNNLIYFTLALIVLFFAIVGLISILLSRQEAQPPAIYQAIPENKEGYYQLVTPSSDLATGDQFDVQILLNNTSQLDDGAGEGIASTDVQVSFDPSQLSPIDLDPATAGVQAQFGTIFSWPLENNISTDTAYILAFSLQTSPLYPYNSNNRAYSEKVFATIRFEVVTTTPDETGSITVQGTDTNTDFTNIYTNIPGYANTDIVNQSLAPNNGNLSLNFNNTAPTDTPTATPTIEPTATPTDILTPTPTPTTDPNVTPTPSPTIEPTATPTPEPDCGDGICDGDAGEDTDTCYEDCCQYTVLSGDLNEDCVINSVDWAVMWNNWTGVENM